ncbi:hypothetical protein OJAV_G00003530 [Oryzias javanicus]|uniref:Uncharacterized protein n=1 Tax=Oryzias javanicus TaxID=123683 RepID=A0A437DN66_ORYJA|nr:hypothetical protein OJAV_G00003530 [Oryzias javanicus]
MNVTEFSQSTSSTAEPPTIGPISTLSPTIDITEFSPSSASTAEPLTKDSTSTLPPATMNVTGSTLLPASTAEPLTVGPSSTLSLTTTTTTGLNPPPASTAEPPVIGSTTTTSTTTTIIAGTTVYTSTTSQSTSVTSTTSTTAILSELTSSVTKVIYTGQCQVIAASESNTCTGVKSTDLQVYLDSGTMSGRFCSFSLEEFACASLSALTAQDLVEIMKCDRSSNSSGSISAWNLLFCKTSKILNAALDFLTTTTINPNNPSVSVILDSIQATSPDFLSTNTLNNPTELQLWFNVRLRPFLPAVSANFLSILATKDLQCSSYQYILQILSEVQSQMTPSRQESVYTQFIKIYLSRNNTADPGCTSNIKSSTEWLQKNVGGFSVLLSIQNIQELYPQFSGVEALSLLSVTQLAEVAAAPGQLTTAEQVTTVMTYVPDQQFASFFDNFSPKILGRENVLPSTVRSAMLQVVFNRANLSSPSVSDSVVLLWLKVRLRPLLVNLVPDHVTPYFNILAGRSCSTEKQGVTFLNSTISTLSDATKTKIQDQIALTLKGTSPLRCYGDSYSISFYSFLKSSFMGFQFPDLTTFLSLMPQDRKQQESLPEPVRQRTLPCVWPMALRSSSRSEVNAWFDRGLPNYLVFLTKTQISQITSVNASCLAFQKIVSALGSYNYSVSDFTNQDVYNTIKIYLSSATAPKCYDSNNPELNSTAWFAEYIGSFITFLTVADLQSFGSELVLRVFTVNLKNIALLSRPKVTLTLISYYTQLVYQQASNFNPLL